MTPQRGDCLKPPAERWAESRSNDVATDVRPFVRLHDPDLYRLVLFDGVDREVALGFGVGEHKYRGLAIVIKGA